MRRTFTALGAVAGSLLLGSTAVGTLLATTSGAPAGAALPIQLQTRSGPPKGPVGSLTPARSAAPDEASCRKHGYRCYDPSELQNAYDVSPLLDEGDGGAGQTIVIVDSFGSPTIKADLRTFDKAYGLPAPPSFKVMAPLGTKPWKASNQNEVGWAEEVSIDVEWSHAMAPKANLVLMTSPVNEDEGTSGMPQFLKLEKMVVRQHLGNIVSQSWGATENTLFNPPGRKIISELDTMYQRADSEHITELAASGDTGAANVRQNGRDYYHFPTVGYPDSSPYVTAVGGTSLYAGQAGTWAAETVWHSLGGASGGGVSQYAAEPSYESQLPATDQRTMDGKRGLPDVAADADPNTGVPIYISCPGVKPGYYVYGGTSVATPLWAGMVADMDQYAGKSLGFLNPALYKLGAEGKLTGSVMHDIVKGNNSVHGVTGYSATAGWDFDTGWGSPEVANLAPLLAEAESQ